jgi:hypothetical protein
LAASSKVVGSRLTDCKRLRTYCVFIEGRWTVQAAGIDPKTSDVAVMQASPTDRQDTTLRKKENKQI